MRLQAPRGTQDILPQEQRYWRFVLQRAEDLARRFGYGRIDTPIFEDARLFQRTVGPGTDIVEKEMYTFTDRGGDLLALRAEGTAPVCRAYLEHGMGSWPQPVRLYYVAPIFRYERPQAGRYRQHHQFGIEAIGDGDPAVDAEVIELGWEFVTGLGLEGLTLQVNSIGCPACRPRYLDALRAYYAQRLDRVCPDCRARYERNLLRVLDCKRTDYACQVAIAEAPRTVDYLCEACADHWQRLLRYLSALEIPYQENPRLVRGLDYYTRTVFEIQPPEEKAQSTLVGGGRYDGLMEELGGPPTPGVGFGSGLERIILNLQRQGVPVPEEPGVQVAVATTGDGLKAEAARLACDLRRAGLSAVLARGQSLRAQMRHATSLGARWAVILGEEEWARGAVALRDLRQGRQEEVPRSALLTALEG